MPSLFRQFLILALAFTVATGSRGSLTSARQASAMLGSETWSEVLEIKNSSRNSPYNKVVYATVFEFEDVLWFYTDADGTQSLSLLKNHAEADKEHLGDLLEKIDPGFKSFRVLNQEALPAMRTDLPGLPNGCFIEALYAEHRLRSEGLAGDFQLVTFYEATALGRIRGHTFLAYQTADGWFSFDPLLGSKPKRLGHGAKKDPLVLARSSGYGTPGSRFVKGVLLAVGDVPGRSPEMIAKNSGHNAPVDNSLTG